MKNIASYNYNADFIRSVAIIFVVILHVTAIFITQSIQTNTSFWWMLLITETSTKVAVPLFIMLSGQLILDPSKEYTLIDFYKRRISKLGIPIIFWPFFYYFCFLFLKRIDLNFAKLVNDFVFLNMFYHLYFLYIIFGLYLFTPFIKKTLKTSTMAEKKALMAGSFVFSAMVATLVYALPTKINYWSIFTVFIPFLCYFLAGDFLRHVTPTKKALYSCLALFVGVTIIVSVCKFFAYENTNIYLIRYLSDALSVGVMVQSVLAFIILLNVTRYKSFLTSIPTTKVIHTLAAASFGIYIIHPMLLFGYGIVINSKSLAPYFASFPSLLSLIMTFSVAFGASFAIVYIGAKIRFVKLLLAS